VRGAALLILTLSCAAALVLATPAGTFGHAVGDAHAAPTLASLCRLGNAGLRTLDTQPTTRRLTQIAALEKTIADGLRANLAQRRTTAIEKLVRQAELSQVHTQRAIKLLAAANKTESMSELAAALKGSRQAGADAQDLVRGVCVPKLNG
jgi:hypothetical protein